MRSLTVPFPPADAAIVNRLFARNHLRSVCLRFHKEIGLIRVAVIKLRYFDRGAGGFMGGGAWVNEGHVICNAFPASSKPFIPLSALTSIAGWSVQPKDLVQYSPPSRVSLRQKKLSAWNKKFWTIDEALSYANGETADEFAASTVPVLVRREEGRIVLTPAPIQEPQGTAATDDA